MGLSIVKWLRKMKRRSWESLGLSSTLLSLGDGTLLHCWVSRHETNNVEAPLTVLLIHGFGADGLSGWDTSLIKALRKLQSVIVVVPDLLFFGESRTECQQRSEMFQAETLKAALDSVGIFSNVVAVGHSYGGFVAFWMAHLYPTLIVSLAFVSSAVCIDSSVDNVELLRELGCDHINDLLVPSDVQALSKGLGLTFHRLPLMILPSFLLRDLFETMGGERQRRLEVAEAIVTGSEKCPPLPLLSQEDFLIVWGEHDRIFPLQQAYRLQRHLGEKTETVIIKGAAHVPQLEKAHETTEALLRFLLKRMAKT